MTLRAYLLPIVLIVSNVMPMYVLFLTDYLHYKALLLMKNFVHAFGCISTINLLQIY